MKKYFLIASQEYELNWPDIFVMDEEGCYYGAVGKSCYALAYDYPDSVDFWKNAQGSDLGRRFRIEEVTLEETDVQAFDEMMRRLHAIVLPRYSEKQPTQWDYKTKKAYKEAEKEYWPKYRAWAEANRVDELSRELRETNENVYKMFLAFSDTMREYLMEYTPVRKIFGHEPAANLSADLDNYGL